jgi:hypothetical protein
MKKAVFFGITALALAVTTVQAQQTIKLGGDDNYSTQTLTVGDKIIIKLGYDRASGYAWQPAAMDPAVLTEDAVKPRATPGTQAFEFTAAGPGVITLTLNNVKKTDPSKPLQIYNVMVAISSPAGQAHSTYVVGHFVGALPCKDCESVQNEITFYAHGANQFVDTIYKRKLTYVGNNKSAEDSGVWVLLPGTAADPSANVYALTPTGSTQQEFFWLKDEETLVPLDQDKKPKDAPMDISLKLQK